MTQDNKYEFWLIALSTLAAAPLIASVGLIVFSGMVVW